MLLKKRFKVYKIATEELPDGTPGLTTEQLIGSYVGEYRGINETEVVYSEILQGKEKPLRLISYIDIAALKAQERAEIFIKINGENYIVLKQNRTRKPFSYLLALKGGGSNG